MSAKDLKREIAHVLRQVDHGWSVQGVWRYDEGAGAWGNPAYFLFPPARRGAAASSRAARGIALDPGLVYAMLNSGAMRRSRHPSGSRSSFYLVKAKATRESRQRASRRQAARERFELSMREARGARRSSSPQGTAARPPARITRHQIAAGQVWVEEAGGGRRSTFEIERVERKRVTYVVRRTVAGRESTPLRLLSTLRRVSAELGRVRAVLAEAGQRRRPMTPLPEALVA